MRFEVTVQALIHHILTTNKTHQRSPWISPTLVQKATMRYNVSKLKSALQMRAKCSHVPLTSKCTNGSRSVLVPVWLVGPYSCSVFLTVSPAFPSGSRCRSYQPTSSKMVELRQSSCSFADVRVGRGGGIREDRHSALCGDLATPLLGCARWIGGGWM